MGRSVRRNLKETNGQQIDSPPPSPAPLSLEEAMEQLYASPRVPECIKKTFGSLVNELSSVRQERDQLREENRLLREQLSLSHASKQCSTQSTVDRETLSPSPHLDCHETEGLRSTLIAGISERKSSFLKQELEYDYSNVMNVLFHLDIQCYPVAIYRLGRPKEGVNRLLKVVLPTTFFQPLAVQRAFWLSSFPKKGIFLRESLTASERERRKKARLNLTNPTDHNSSRFPSLQVSESNIENCCVECFFFECFGKLDAFRRTVTPRATTDLSLCFAVTISSNTCRNQPEELVS
ncbi:hypothetical protein Aduo_008843 [Ancylostoma duodenale]